MRVSDRVQIPHREVGHRSRTVQPWRPSCNEKGKIIPLKLMERQRSLGRLIRLNACANEDRPAAKRGGLSVFYIMRIEPMLPTLARLPFSNRDWLFETKWDGFGAIC